MRSARADRRRDLRRSPLLGFGEVAADVASGDRERQARRQPVRSVAPYPPTIWSLRLRERVAAPIGRFGSVCRPPSSSSSSWPRSSPRPARQSRRHRRRPRARRRARRRRRRASRRRRRSPARTPDGSPSRRSDTGVASRSRLRTIRRRLVARRPRPRRAHDRSVTARCSRSVIRSATTSVGASSVTSRRRRG